MSLTIAQMRSLVRKPLGVEETDDGWSDTDVDLLLNMTLWELTEILDLRLKEEESTDTTVDGTRDYDMPAAYEALEIVSITDPDTNKHVPLIRTTDIAVEQVYDEDEDSRGFPTHYYRRNGFIRLHPTPDDEYTLNIFYRQEVSSIDTDSTATGLPRNWDEIVVAGAIARGYINLGDWIRSNAAESRYHTLIGKRTPTKAKEAKDENAGLRILGYRNNTSKTGSSGRYNRF
jgi:hypothetical protein